MLAWQARYQIHTIGLRADDVDLLCRKACVAQPRRHRLGRFGRDAGRVRGVDLDQLAIDRAQLVLLG